MDARTRFHKMLRKCFFPILRNAGFTGKGLTHFRLVGERIDLINIQGSTYSNHCYVNLGVHFRFLPTAGGRPVDDPSKLKEYECEFRDRLGDTQSWEYGHSEARAEKNVLHLVDVFNQDGWTFFKKFEPFPEVFEALTPQQILADRLSRYPVRTIPANAAIVMARIMRHLGRAEEGRAFAKAGLQIVGTAVALKAELESLRDAP